MHFFQKCFAVPPEALAGDGVWLSFAPVFVKCIFKYQKSTGERVVHYRLVESYRKYDQVKHETILNLGPLTELPDVEQKKAAARRISELLQQSVTGQSNLFVSADDVVEKMALEFFNQIKQKQSITQG